MCFSEASPNWTNWDMCMDDNYHVHNRMEGKGPIESRGEVVGGG